MRGNEKITTDADALAKIRKLSSRAVAVTDTSYAKERDQKSKHDGRETENQMTSIGDLTSERQRAAQTILKTTPDVGRAIAIITGLAVCPTGGTRAKLTFNMGRMGEVADEDGNIARIISKIQEFFTNTLDIETPQYKRLYDILSVKGARITAILPDNTVDKIINSCENSTSISLESLYRQGVTKSQGVDSDGGLALPSLGLLGNGRKEKNKVSLESAFGTGSLDRNSYNSSLIVNASKSYVDVIDNPDILKVPTLLEYNNNAKIGLALEAYSKSALRQNDTDLHPNYHLRRKYKVSPQVALTNPNSYEGSGRPILIDIPADVFTPVYYPGDPERRYGGFVLLDEFGSPLTNQTEEDAYQRLMTSPAGGSGSNTDSALQKIEQMTSNGTLNLSNIRDDQIHAGNFRIFQELMEKELQNRLTHGAGASNYQIGDDDVFYRIMLSRALAKKRTRVLFIPEKMLSYQAVHYDEHGIGISMVARNRLISTIRTVLFYSNFMGALSNSMQRKKVRLKLDPNDRNINRTIETAIGELINSQATVSDVLRSQGPADTIEALQKASVSVEIDDSDIPGMPQTKISMEDERRNIQEIDSTYMEELRKLQMMDYSISPEIVDGSFTPNFAAQVYRENDITARMISEIVDATSHFNTEFVRKYIELDPVLVRDLLMCVKIKRSGKGKKDDVTDEVVPEVEKNENNIVSGVEDYEERLRYLQRALDVLWVAPPNPELDGLDHNYENFENFKKVLDSVLDAKLNDGLGRGLRGDMGEVYELLKATLRQRYIDSYLRRSDMLPELREELTNDERLSEILEDEIQGLDDFLPILEKAALLLGRTTTGLERKQRMEEDEVNKRYDEMEEEIREREAEIERQKQEALDAENADSEEGDDVVDDELEEETPEEESEETLDDEDSGDLDLNLGDEEEETPEEESEDETEEESEEGSDDDLDFDDFKI